jgi:mono/diheme cytochrome c family protein
MALSRTTKTIAKRIDLDHFRIPWGMRKANRILIASAALVAALWAGYYAFSKDNRIYNPGPVSAAHANFEHNCAACHTGDGHGGFDRGVADDACLQCHDGAIHHSNQVTLVSGNGMRSSNCATCHVEHRGHAALAATGDQHCVQCHGNLPANTKGGKTDLAAVVTGFSTGEHPQFGRELSRDGQWIDLTVVKFNHAKHMPMEGINNNCVVCHSTSEAVPVAQVVGKAPGPPWISQKDRPARWTGSVERRYMLPITYERHCVACHELKVTPNGPTLAHERMEVVRAQIASLPLQLLEMLSRDPEREKKLVEEKVGPPPRRVKTTRKITAEEWVGGQMKSLMDRVTREAEGAQGYAELQKALPAPTTTMPVVGLASPQANVVEFHTAFAATNRCTLCHETSGELPAVYVQGPSAATQGKRELLRTVPTGMPAMPRRWFANSHFDHDAHRNVSCVDCHRGAEKSVATSDALMPKMQACVSCHHSPQGGVNGATTSCFSCHSYHDHSRDQVPPVAAKK